MHCPPTAVPVATSLVGVAGACGAFATIYWFNVPASIGIVLLLVACALPMWVMERRRHPGRGAGSSGRPLDWLFGAFVILLLFVSSFWVQLRWGGSKGGSVAEAELLGLCAFLLMVGIAGWDRYVGYDDSVSRLGRQLRGAQLKDGRLMEVLLEWVVKAFFLPLMLGGGVVWLYFAGNQGSMSLRAQFAVQVMAFLYAIDVAFGSVGYMLTSARIGAHIRSVDMTWLGWLSALVCYPPLSVLVFDTFLIYKTAHDWRYWLSDSPALALACGTAIILTVGVYTWSTVAFGPRFSNLTYRGVITSGPYRFMLHPAYVSKNISWWLVSMPFFSASGWRAAVLHSAALLTVNIIYWVRAKTEERHLSRYPEYMAYRRWIEERGVLARLKRSFALARA